MHLTHSNTNKHTLTCTQGRCEPGGTRRLAAGTVPVVVVRVEGIMVRIMAVMG